MRRTPALVQLADTIAAARQNKLLIGGDGLERLHELAQTVLHEAVEEWLPEAAFRLRTGASAKWCRGNFARCEAKGVARKVKGRREWHVSARIPRANATNREALVREIADSFREAS